MAHQDHTAQHSTHEVGFVVEIKNYLINIEGIPRAKPGDLLVSENGVRAIVTVLTEDAVRAMILDVAAVRPGDRYALVGTQNIFSFGDHLFGRVIDSLGSPIDGKSNFPEPTKPFQFDTEALGMESRQRIDEQFFTGITMIDTLLPIAKGQRELIFGPTHSGKLEALRDIVVNQKDQGIICIYAVIGKPLSVLAPLVRYIHKKEGNQNAIIIASPSNETTPRIAITPAIAMSTAEYFREKGNTVLLILDDLATHAKYMREIALLSEQLPGRESYPGDMFYQHAHIIERAGNFNESFNGGSITLLPVLETEIENYSDLIPTNLMSATDGHLMFNTSLHSQGIYPAISEEQSVTRVGKNAQSLIQKQLSTRLTALLARYRREKEFVQFGAPINIETQKILKQGEFAYSILRQEPGESIGIMAQITLLSLVFSQFCANHDVPFFETNRTKLIQAIQEDTRLKDLEQSMHSLDRFIEFLDKKLDIFEEICQS